MYLKAPFASFLSPPCLRQSSTTFIFFVLDSFPSQPLFLLQMPYGSLKNQ